MISRIRSQGSRHGFTLVELLVVIAIIAVLIGLLVPAVQRAREAANRSKCQSNIRQLGIAFMNFESGFKGLPRGGEHLIQWTDGKVYKTQDLQSPFTLILPYVEQDGIYQKYDMRRRYNESPQNIAVAQNTIPIFYCPTNPLSGDRVGSNGRDSAGFGCVDYTTAPYTQLDATGTDVSAAAQFWPTALTGSPYPVNFYQKYATGDPTVSSSKTVQLDNVANFGLIDATWGLPKIASIGDGTSNSLMLYEDVGRNEFMAGGTNEYYDPVTSTGRRWWRWAEPDTSSGVSKKVNNNPGATYTTADPNGTGCTWRNHDCGPNNEIFSFHVGGAHVVFADAHVTFLRDTVSIQIVRAICTRSDGANEAAVEGID